MFTDSLRLAELAEFPNQRPRLILGWMNHSFHELKGLFHSAAKIGLDKDPAPVLAKLSEQQREIHLLRAKLGIARLGKFRPEGDAAKRYGRADDFWTFLLSHEVIHGSDAAFLFRRSPIAEGRMELFAQTADLKMVEAVGAYAALSMMMAVSSVSTIFQWALPADFADVRERLEHIPEVKNSAPPGPSSAAT